MKKVNVRFNLTEHLDEIDVVVHASAEDSQVRNLMDRVADPLAGTLTVYDESSVMRTIPETSIVSISTDNKRLIVRTGDGTYELRMALKEVRKQLHPTRFLQISRFEIINLDQVRRFDFSVSGTLQVELKDDTRTWASRRLIPEIKNRLAGKE